MKKMQSEQKKREITISHNNRHIRFRVNENGNINLELVKQYFPKAGGLLYSDSEGNIHGLNLLEGEIILNPQICTYEVHIPSALEEGKMNKAGQNRVKEILEKMKRPIDAASHRDSLKLSNKVKKTPSTIDKVINVPIGWMHKKRGDPKYQLVREPLGGTKHIQLSKAYPYTVSEVIELGINEFKKNGLWLSHSNNIVYLGADSDIIEEFRNNTGDRCGIWEFFKLQNIAPCRIRVYLFSEEQILDGDETHLIHEGPSSSCVSSLKRSCQQVDAVDLPAKKQKKPFTFADIRNLTTMHEIRKQIINQEVSSSANTSNFTSKSKGKANIQDEPAVKAHVQLIEKKSIRSSNLPSTSGSQQKLFTTGNIPLILMEGDETSPECSSSDVDVGEPVAVSQEYPRAPPVPPKVSGTDPDEVVDNIEVYYHKITVSQYSGELSVVEYTKSDLFDVIDSDDLGRFDYRAFDPVASGYPISRIVKDNQVLLQVLINDDMSKEYTFPSKDVQRIDEHLLLYDSLELNGFCSGKFGFGAIISCQESCSPMISWYRNDVLVARAVRLYWYDDGVALDGSQWHCAVDCLPNVQFAVDRPIPVDEEESSNILDELRIPSHQELSIPDEEKVEEEVPENKKINMGTGNQKLLISDTLLGAGAQGRVFKGKYGSTDVAIRSIKFPGTASVLEADKIQQLRRINHVNIMQIMDVLENAKYLHIVMPLFPSHALDDILFMGNIKQKYCLTMEMKNSIGDQVCKALEYLHLQQPPIVHGDLRPCNILVNLQGSVKLSDLTSGFLSKMADAMNDNVITNILDSMMFLAPEIMGRSSVMQTISSDVWALGCTFVELYSEEYVWNLGSHDRKETLQNLLLANATPDVTSIPEILQGIVLRCFAPEPKLRPSVEEIQSLYALINEDF